uniref:BACK domain-containing protein n=1 Tax=Heterorhabditis bacteriophora TaxID=37862 RepID=A0A1I7XV23_HETBA
MNIFQSMKAARRPRDQVLAIGGWSNGRALSRIDLYDQVHNKWIPLSQLCLIHPVAYHGSVVLDNELYVIGGCDGDNYFSTVMKLTKEMKWIEVAPMYEQRYVSFLFFLLFLHLIPDIYHNIKIFYFSCYISNSCCVLDGKIYVCGGTDGRVQRRERLRCAERYDPVLNRWEKIASMRHMRSDAAATGAAGRLYVAGGFNGTEVMASVEMYIPHSDVWTDITAMPGPRSGKDIVVACGYANNSTMANTERFDGGKWIEIAKMNKDRSALKVISMSDWDEIGQNLVALNSKELLTHTEKDAGKK